MRDIKFRAWHKGDQLMLDSLVLRQSAFNDNGVHLIYDVLVAKKWMYEVMQYTGLKDKNGKEIYEGDVVDIKGATCNEYDFRGIVSFYDGTFCLAAMRQTESAKKHGYLDRVRFWKDGCHDHHSLEMIESFEMEVLGNRHDNPELLEVKTEV